MRLRCSRRRPRRAGSRQPGVDSCNWKLGAQRAVRQICAAIGGLAKQTSAETGEEIEQTTEWQCALAIQALAKEGERLRAENQQLRGPIRTAEAVDWSLTAEEIDRQFRALVIENRRLLETVEDQRLRIDAIMQGCAERGIEGTTPALLLIWRLEMENQRLRGHGAARQRGFLLETLLHVQGLALAQITAREHRRGVLKTALRSIVAICGDAVTNFEVKSREPGHAAAAAPSADTAQPAGPTPTG